MYELIKFEDSQEVYVLFDGIWLFLESLLL